MSARLKPGSRVLTADGAELVLIDKAPVNIYRYADDGRLVSPRAYRDIRDIAHYGGPIYRHADRNVTRERTSGPGKGAAWWAHDARTGAVLPRSVRESELTLITERMAA